MGGKGMRATLGVTRNLQKAINKRLNRNRKTMVQVRHSGRSRVSVYSGARFGQADGAVELELREVRSI